MKQRIYIDTSVIGGCFDAQFSKWSNKLMDHFNRGIKTAIISDLTLKELELAPTEIKNVLDSIDKRYLEYVLLNEEAISLAANYLKDAGFSERFLIDAQHIAMATINKVDVMVSWNFKHIVNLSRIRLYNSVNLKLGYGFLEIRAPREVVYEEGD